MNAVATESAGPYESRHKGYRDKSISVRNLGETGKPFTSRYKGERKVAITVSVLSISYECLQKKFEIM